MRCSEGGEKSVVVKSSYVSQSEVLGLHGWDASLIAVRPLKFRFLGFGKNA